MIRKMTLVCILFISIFMLAATGRTESVFTIIDNLRSQDDDLVEATCKKLGLDRGAILLAKVQLLSPNVESTSRSLFIIGISWEGPSDGCLIIMDKDGNIIDKKDLGYIKQLSLIQLMKADVNDFLLVDSIQGTGTGMELDQYTVLSITNKGFLKLWNGTSYEKSVPGVVAPEANYVIKAFVTFEDIDDDGTLELIYQKKIVKYRYLPKTKQFKAEPTIKGTEIFKLKKIGAQRYIYEKISNK